MTERVTRFDRGTVSKVERTPQGYLRVDGFATRTGVLEYRNKDGSIRRELRHPDEVSKADSLATLAGVSITDDHPWSEPGQLLTAENTSRLARGFTGDQVVMDGDKVAVRTTITDADLIAKVEAGKQRELSPGYTCDLVLEPGVWQGQRYDARQTNIVYNHLAVVPRGRAGPEARLRLDAAEQIDETDGNQEEGQPVATINIDGVNIEVSESAAVAIQAKFRADSLTITEAKADAQKAKDEASAALKRADELQGKLDAADDQLKQRADAADRLPELVKARRALERQAEPILPKETKLDEMSDTDIKKAVIKAVSPDAKLDGQSDAYVDARFDAAVEIAETRVDSTGELRKAAGEAKRSDGAPDSDKARGEMIKRNSEAWKQPLTSKGGN